MTNSEIIEILQYMRHDVLANSDRDIALVKAIEALSIDFSTLNPSDRDIIVARVDMDHIYDRDVAERICEAISRQFGDTPVIFIGKNIDFTVESKSEVISELQDIIDTLSKKNNVDSPKMSNADKIRQMTDDELCHFLDRATDSCHYRYCDECPLKYSDKVPRCNISKWLKQEKSEDAAERTY